MLHLCRFDGLYQELRFFKNRTCNSPCLRHRPIKSRLHRNRNSRLQIKNRIKTGPVFMPSRQPLSTVSKLHTMESNVLIKLSPFEMLMKTPREKTRKCHINNWQTNTPATALLKTPSSLWKFLV